MHCISIHFAGSFLYAVFKVYAYTMRILCKRRFLYVVGKGECENYEVGVAQTRGTGYSIFLAKEKHSKLFSKPSKIL